MFRRLIGRKSVEGHYRLVVTLNSVVVAEVFLETLPKMDEVISFGEPPNRVAVQVLKGVDHV